MIIQKILSTVAAVGLSLAAFATPSVADDNDWPNRPITVVVTFAAGGNADIQTRMEARYLEEILGQPIQVINVPGGGHVPGVMHFLNEPADGYTWMRISPPPVIAPLVREVPYDLLNDIAPAWLNTTGTPVLYVPADSPIETLDDFIAASQAESLIMGVNNIGAPPHLSAVSLSQQFGVEYRILTFKTIPASLTGMIGGQADAAIGQTTHLQRFPGEIRPLVILGPREEYFERHLPGVPTLSELQPEMSAGGWLKSGWVARSGTDQAIIDEIAAAAAQVFENPQFQEEYASLSTLVPLFGTQEILDNIEEGQNFYRPLLSSLGLLYEE